MRSTTIYAEDANLDGVIDGPVWCIGEEIPVFLAVKNGVLLDGTYVVNVLNASNAIVASTDDGVDSVPITVTSGRGSGTLALTTDELATEMGSDVSVELTLFVWDRVSKDVLINRAITIYDNPILQAVVDLHAMSLNTEAITAANALIEAALAAHAPRAESPDGKEWTFTIANNGIGTWTSDT